MNNKTLIGMTLAVVMGILVLLAININNKLNVSANAEFLKPGDVRGSAVEYKGELYTLNFNQQNELIEYLNTAVAVQRDLTKSSSPLAISKIIIYRFKDPDVEIFPKSLERNNLIFLASVWNKSSPLMELSGGQLTTMLDSTYDP